MCCNGVVGPDLALHLGAYEIKKVQAPLGIWAESQEDLMAGRLKLWNKYLCLDLGHLDITWELLEDGKPLQSGSLPPVRLPAGERGEMRVPFNAPRPRPGAEYHLNQHFCLVGSHGLGAQRPRGELGAVQAAAACRSQPAGQPGGYVRAGAG